MTHRVSKSYGGRESPVCFIIDDTGFIEKYHGISSAFGNDRTIVMFQNPFRLADAVFDQRLERAFGRSDFDGVRSVFLRS